VFSFLCLSTRPAYIFARLIYLPVRRSAFAYASKLLLSSLWISRCPDRPPNSPQRQQSNDFAANPLQIRAAPILTQSVVLFHLLSCPTASSDQQVSGRGVPFAPLMGPSSEPLPSSCRADLIAADIGSRLEVRFAGSDSSMSCSA
jgi:hypothetical protein